MHVRTETSPPSGPLRYAVSTLCCLVFLTGCASQRTTGVSVLDEYHRRLATTSTLDVPPPSATSYDADPEARLVYLNAFRGGYRSGATGYFLTRCLGQTPHRSANVSGWYDGQSAGALIAKAKTAPLLTTE